MISMTWTAAIALTLACAPTSPSTVGTEKPAQGPPTVVAEPATPASPAALPAFDQSHARWTRILAKHVDGDRIDYKAIKKDRSELDAYLKELGSVTPAELAKWSEKERYAFWINVYNAFTVSLVVENYPVESIKDIGSLLSSVWKKRFIPLTALDPEGKGQELSLDVVEHGILRERFKDARVHAAVNCASESCPPLRNEAFVAKRIDAQLDEQVRAWLADSKRNRYDRKNNEINVSAIFDWFESDFERDAGSVQKWIAKYAPESEASWIRSAKGLDIEHLDYSWELNEVKR